MRKCHERDLVIGGPGIVAGAVAGARTGSGGGPNAGAAPHPGATLHLYERPASETAPEPEVTLVLHGGPGLFSLEQQIADLEAVRASTGAGTVRLLGHSAGANLALAYAMTHPKRVRSVTYLSGTGIGNWRPDYRAERERRLGPERLARLTELGQLPKRGHAEEREFRLLAWCTDYATVEAGLRLAEQDADAPFPINIEANKSIGDPDFTRLSALKVGVAVVHGEADPRPYWSAKQLADTLPNATFSLIPGAGHNRWRENPGAIRSALRS